MSKSKPRPKSPVPRRKRYEPTPPPPSRSTIKKEKWRATPTVQPQKANTPVVKTEDETEPSAPLGKLPSAPLQTQPSLSPKVVAGPPPGLEATARYDWANFENGTGPAPDMVFSVYTNHNTEAYITPSKSRTQSINDGARSYDLPQRATTNESSSSQRKRKRGSAEAAESRVQFVPIAGEDNHSSQLRKPREQTPIAAPYEPSGSGSPVPPENELPLSSRPVNRTDPADVDFENPDGLPNDLAIGSILAGRYDIMSIFGRGHFSTCFEAYDMSDNKRVNIKRFNPRWCGVGESEANMLEHFRNSSRLVNIDTTFWEAAEVGEGFITQSIDTFHIVTEVLYPDATVSLPECACSIDHPSIACPVRHKALAKIMSQVLSGLAELHSRGYIHADLTPSNILSSTGRGNAVKIIDLSNAIPRDERVSYEEDYNVQTACYRSPEMMLGHGPIGKHIDVWSAGVIALELLFGNDIVIPGGIEGAELLRSPVEGRDAIVRRMIDIFGSVKSCEGGKYWLEVYKELGTRWGWDKKQGKIELDENRGAICDVLAQIENKPLQRFLAGMVNTDYEERSTVDEALRDPWLVSTLLGEWGTVLMNPGWCEDEDVYSEGGRRVRRRISTPRRQVRDFGVQTEIPDSPPLFKPGPNDFETSPTPPMSNEEEDEDDYVDLVR